MEEKAQGYISWTDNTNDAMDRAADNISSYDGILSATASRRSFLDIEPNISVRTDFNRDDYYRFRPGEEPGDTFKRAMAQCMKAYEKVGIIKNIIDLMGDFASQGITLNHKDKKIERFYRKWWEMVGGTERSERFLNMLYRCGNVIINKRYARLSSKEKEQMSKAIDSIAVPKEVVYKKQIPLKYDFLNPMSIEVDGGYAGSFTGEKRYKMMVSPVLKKSFEKHKDLIDQLPESIKPVITGDAKWINLDPKSLEVFHYKKDDWSLWANPMINPIIDDVFMLEKMKLADMSALDGAISNIRLWSLGSLEHKILPNKGAIDKLRDILASNVGGGTMDLVWGPELTFKESNTQIYKFLGDQKYIPVLNSIYAGIGIPPTLTGLAGQSGGFSNNFISLKTLIERLEYGRNLLRQFWQKEIVYIQKAMGFRIPAVIHFDHMLLSDEAAEKNLLMQLADRDIISVETLRCRFGEMQDIEESRVKAEYKKRERGAMPPKSDPYHNGDAKNDFYKIALQKDNITLDKITDIDPKDVKETPQVNPGISESPKRKVDKGGRPKMSKDTAPRKQKRVLPKTTPKNSAALMIWSQEAQKKISDILNPGIINFYEKKNLRELSKSQLVELEDIKFRALCNIEPFSEITEKTLASIMENALPCPSSFMRKKDSVLAEFMAKNERSPSIDELRHIYAISYSISNLEKNS